MNNIFIDECVFFGAALDKPMFRAIADQFVPVGNFSDEEADLSFIAEKKVNPVVDRSHKAGCGCMICLKRKAVQ